MSWPDQDLNRELQHALAREEPPAGFADRLLARAARPPAVWPRWLAAAAAVVALAGAGLGYRQYRGEVAKQQVLEALRITADKVNRIQQHVREAGQ